MILDKMRSDIHISESKSFLVFVAGMIEFAIFPLGPESNEIFCRFQIITGSTWELISGTTKGISQSAASEHANDKVIFNLPFECVYRSSTFYGWPRIVVCLYAKNRWSVETVIGYCWVQLPVSGSALNKISQPILVPKSSSVMGELLTWITSRNVELKDFKTLVDDCENKEFISMEKNGELKLLLQTLCRGTNEANYSSISQDPFGETPE